ncbi:hypothetical protein F5B20DRAFT_518785 [Whalleya microplaca]|nr:hypothetical protein F5B20DRAFT_518785 [Whalleya microplaca]
MPTILVEMDHMHCVYCSSLKAEVMSFATAGRFRQSLQDLISRTVMETHNIDIQALGWDYRCNVRMQWQGNAINDPNLLDLSDRELEDQYEMIYKRNFIDTLGVKFLTRENPLPVTNERYDNQAAFRDMHPARNDARNSGLTSRHIEEQAGRSGSQVLVPRPNPNTGNTAAWDSLPLQLSPLRPSPLRPVESQHHRANGHGGRASGSGRIIPVDKTAGSAKGSTAVYSRFFPNQLATNAKHKNRSFQQGREPVEQDHDKTDQEWGCGNGW